MPSGRWARIRLHYYTLPSGSFETKNKGPALSFNEADWIITLKHTLKIDEMVSKHSAIMDKHDPAEEGRALRG